MEETLRVKIVADTAQANSSFKSLNKETHNLTGSTDSATQAAQKLNKVFSSLGIKGLQFTGIVNGIKSVTNGLRTATSTVGKFFSSVNEASAARNFNKLHKISQNATSGMASDLTKLKSAWSQGIVDDAAMKSFAKNLKYQTKMMKSLPLFDQRLYGGNVLKLMNKDIIKMQQSASLGLGKEFGKTLKHLNDTFSTTLSKPIKMIDRIKVALKSLISVIGNVVKVATVAIAAIAAIGGALLIKNAFSVSKLGDDIDKTSQKVGMSTGAFQKWSYVLERCGLEASQLQTAMRGLTRNSINNADRFTALGIDPSKLSQQQLFEQTVKALQNISNSTERARKAYQLFGQSSAELAPLLGLTSAEVERLTYQYDLLGAVMDGRVVRASADMRDAITDLRAAWQGLKNTLAQYIIPIITKLVIRLTVFVAKVNMILQALFGVELEYEEVEYTTAQTATNIEHQVSAARKLKTLISGFDELNIFPSENSGADLGSFLDELGDWGTGGTPIIGDILPEDAIQELEDFKAHLDETIEKIQNFISAIQGIWDAFTHEKEPETWLEKIAFDIGSVVDWWWELLGLPEIDWENYSIGQFFEDIKTELNSPVFTEDTAFGRFMNDVIDWIYEVAGWDLDWSTIFSNPFSLESMFGVSSWEEFEENFYSSPIGQLFTSQFWSTLWNGDENTTGLYDMIIQPFVDGWNQIKDWDIWKKSWWSGKWDNIKESWNNSKIKKFFEDAWGGIKTFFSGIGDWDIWKKSWWSGKWQSVKDAWNNSKIKKFFEDSWDGIKTFFGGIKDWDIFKKDWWTTKWQKVKDGWNNSKIKKFFEDGWNGVKTFFGGIAEWNIFKKDWWQNKWKGIKDGWDNSKIKSFLSEKWDGIKTWFNEKVKPKFTGEFWKTKWETIKTGLSGANIKAKISEVWENIKTWFNEKVKPKFTGEYWKGKWETIKTGLGNVSIIGKAKEKWEEIKTWWNENVKPKFTIDFWKTKWNTIKDGIGYSSILTGIVEKWTAVKTWWNQNVKTKFTMEYWKTKWNQIKEGLGYSSILTGIKEKWTAVKTWWQENISPKFTWAYWKARWNNIAETLATIDLGNAAKKMMNSLLTAVENGINKAIDAINNSGIAQFLGISLARITIPKFQTYAKGGVIDQPTLGIMGEYPGANSNPEIVTPENKMREVFEEGNNDIADVLIQGFRQIIQAIEEKEDTITVDGMVLARSVAKANSSYRNMTGQSLI